VTIKAIKPALFALFLAAPLAALAQPADQPKAAPNPTANHYKEVPGFFKMPPGRQMGSSSAVFGDSKGNIWVVDRCAANSCVDSKLDPIMEFDANGKFIKAFGAGLLQFAHGIFIDSRDHIWVTDNVPTAGKGGKGQVVLEFDPSGKLLRTMGKVGVAGSAPNGFTEPNAVLIAPDGSIFVAEGHTKDYKGHPHIIKFDKNGKFIKQWGSPGNGPGQFGMPHCLAMDSKGNLYVGDRDNNRIQVFTQDGKFLGQFTQFSRPSGIVIDKNDILYATDSESKNKNEYGHHPGFKRGVRIGSVKDGVVTDFIPDTWPNPEDSPTSGGEGIWADGKGAVYVAQVGQKSVLKFVKR
jgi:outer membrane protein assembly factor BamB